MATTSQADQLAEVHLALLDLYRNAGLVRQRTGWTPGSLARIARDSGQTVAQVQDQLSGAAVPLPGQALALVRALRLAGEHITGTR